ncbi:MAG: hypothetical protein ACD_75C01900G0002 [uncultured bacterium]|nr:MAG: hypothetical protein ACD_75C01900G0002 [uncultured bacterium]
MIAIRPLISDARRISASRATSQPSTILSRTLPRKSVTSCGTQPMKRRSSDGSICRISVPSMATMPLSGSYSPSIILPKVVLPEPIAPMMPTFSPGAIFSEMSFKAIKLWSGYVKHISLNSISPFSPTRCRKVLLGGRSTGMAIT